MRHAFLMDPIEGIQIHLDSTFALMMEAQKRGHEVFYGLIDGLDQRGGRARAKLQQAELHVRVRVHAVVVGILPPCSVHDLAQRHTPLHRVRVGRTASQ